MDTNMDFLINTDVNKTSGDYSESLADILAGSVDSLTLPNQIDFTLPSQIESQFPIQANQQLTFLPNQREIINNNGNNLVLNEWHSDGLGNHNLNDIDFTTMLNNPSKQHSDNDSDSGVCSSSASCSYDTSPRSKLFK